MRQEVLDQLLPAAIMRLHREGYLPKGIAERLNCPVGKVEAIIQRQDALLKGGKSIRAEQAKIDQEALIQARLAAAAVEDSQREKERIAQHEAMKARNKGEREALVAEKRAQKQAIAQARRDENARRKEQERIARLEEKQALRNARLEKAQQRIDEKQALRNARNQVKQQRLDEEKRLLAVRKEKAKAANDISRARKTAMKEADKQSRREKIARIQVMRSQGMTLGAIGRVMGVGEGSISLTLLRNPCPIDMVMAPVKRKVREPKKIKNPKNGTPCPLCQSVDTSKCGYGKPNQHSGARVQRYVCNGCGKLFNANWAKGTKGDHRPDLNLQIVHGTLEGKTVETISRELSTSNETVRQKIKRMAAFVRKHLDQCGINDREAWITVLTTNTKNRSNGCAFLYAVIGVQTGDVLEFNFSKAISHRLIGTLADVARISYPGLNLSQTPPVEGPAQRTVEELSTLCDLTISRVKNVQGAGARMYLWMGLRKGLFSSMAAN